MTTFATFDHERGRQAFYFDSYWGGDRYRAPSSPTMGRSPLTTWQPRRDAEGRETQDFDEKVVAWMDSYLVPHTAETKQAFSTRVSLAVYVNVIMPIVDAYVDAVTGNTTRTLGELDRYLGSLDGRGRTWADHVEEVARWATVYGMCATVMDVPKVNPSTSRADEEALGIGLRATLVHPTAFAWIALDDEGAVEEFAFVDAPYLPTQSGTQTVRFWVYTTSTWALYEQDIVVSAGFGAVRVQLANLTPVRAGVLPASLNGRCPVVFAYFRQDTSSATPRGVPLTGDACDIARAIYNTLSMVEEFQRKTTAFLAIPENSAGGQLEPSTRMQVGPSTALGYPSTTGAPSWVHPGTENTQDLRTHALFLAMLALRTTGLEVTSSDASPDASGEALKVRSRDFDSRCLRFSRTLASFEREALGMAAQILGMTAPPPPTYPKRFTLPSPADDLARAILFMQTFDTRVGPRGVAAATKAAVEAALALSDEQVAAIMTDVNALAEQSGELDKLRAAHEELRAQHHGASQMLAQVLERNRRGELVMGNPLAPDAAPAEPDVVEITDETGGV